MYTSISKANISNGNERKLEMWRVLCDICTSNRILQLKSAIANDDVHSVSFFFVLLSSMWWWQKKCRWRWLKNKKQAGYEQFIGIGHLLLLSSSSDVIRLQIASSINDMIVILNVHIAVIFFWTIFYFKQACY